MSDRTVTRSIESDVAPGVILSILMDPQMLPKWAPAFADMAEKDEKIGWRVTKDGRVFTLEIVVSRQSGTVDYLREIAPGKKGGAYVRVLPRPNGGSVVVMTLPVPQSTEIERVNALLSQELETLVRLGESNVGSI